MHGPGTLYCRYKNSNLQYLNDDFQKHQKHDLKYVLKQMATLSVWFWKFTRRALKGFQLKVLGLINKCACTYTPMVFASTSPRRLSSSRVSHVSGGLYAVTNNMFSYFQHSSTSYQLWNEEASSIIKCITWKTTHVSIHNPHIHQFGRWLSALTLVSRFVMSCKASKSYSLHMQHFSLCCAT